VRRIDFATTNAKTLLSLFSPKFVRFQNGSNKVAILLVGVRFYVYCHVTYDVNKSGKFGHSSQPRATLVRSFQPRELPATTDIILPLL